MGFTNVTNSLILLQNFTIVINLRAILLVGTIFLIWYRLYYYVYYFILFGHPLLQDCLRPRDLVLIKDFFQFFQVTSS